MCRLKTCTHVKATSRISADVAAGFQPAEIPPLARRLCRLKTRNRFSLLLRRCPLDACRKSATEACDPYDTARAPIPGHQPNGETEDGSTFRKRAASRVQLHP